MNKINVALCQMNVMDDKEKNIEKAILMIKQSKKQGADLAVLPEMFNCPYENEKFIEYAEELEESVTLKEIAKVAKEENIHVLAGSIPELELNEKNNDDKDNINEKQSIYNTSVFFDNHGKILGKHRKMHLFDIDVKGKIYFKESDTLSAGNEFTVIKTDLAKIGIGICYDIRFVELSRIMALEGAEILKESMSFNNDTKPVLLFYQDDYSTYKTRKPNDKDTESYMAEDLFDRDSYINVTNKIHVRSHKELRNMTWNDIITSNKRPKGATDAIKYYIQDNYASFEKEWLQNFKPVLDKLLDVFDLN